MVEELLLFKRNLQDKDNPMIYDAGLNGITAKQ
jgi:hypothetical protein